jgi:hypothetical protein
MQKQKEYRTGTTAMLQALHGSRRIAWIWNGELIRVRITVPDYRERHLVRIRVKELRRRVTPLQECRT